MAMGRHKTISADLPRRMSKRTWTDKRGQAHVAYYYLHPRDANGVQRQEPLGTDKALALRKWAELEGDLSTVPAIAGLIKPVIDRYGREIVPTKAPRTQRDNGTMLDILRNAFGGMTFDQVQPRHVRQYLDKRSAKVRANREMALFSHLWNKAREWGYTDRANPVQGVEKNRETGRDIYVTDEELRLVKKHAPAVVVDLIDLCYLTGQRPADVRKLRWDQVKESALWITQGKTGAKLRIAIEGELATVIDRCRARDNIRGLWLLTDPSGQPLKEFGFLRSSFDAARDAAASEAKALGISFRRWQIRDLRPKAASDLPSMAQARKLLGHTTENMTAHYVRQRVGELVKPVK